MEPPRNPPPPRGAAGAPRKPPPPPPRNPPPPPRNPPPMCPPPPRPPPPRPPRQPRWAWTGPARKSSKGTTTKSLRLLRIVVMAASGIKISARVRYMRRLTSSPWKGQMHHDLGGLYLRVRANRGPNHPTRPYSHC